MLKHIREWIRGWLLLSVALLVFVLGLILNLPEFHGLPWPYTVYVVFLFLTIVYYNLQLQHQKNTHPNIVADEQFFLERPFHLVVNNELTDTVIERYYLVLRNVKRRGINLVDTDPVHAVIDFYDVDGNKIESLSHERPFWLNAGRPWDRPKDFRTIIRASSEPQGLCLVARKQGIDKLYVFSDNSYIPNIHSLDPFRPELELPDPIHRIRVQLGAGNLDIDPIWISLTNMGKEEAPKLKLLSKNNKPHRSQR